MIQEYQSLLNPENLIRSEQEHYELFKKHNPYANPEAAKDYHIYKQFAEQCNRALIDIYQDKGSETLDLQGMPCLDVQYMGTSFYFTIEHLHYDKPMFKVDNFEPNDIIKEYAATALRDLTGINPLQPKGKDELGNIIYSNNHTYMNESIYPVEKTIKNEILNKILLSLTADFMKEYQRVSGTSFFPISIKDLHVKDFEINNEMRSISQVTVYSPTLENHVHDFLWDSPKNNYTNINQSMPNTVLSYNIMKEMSQKTLEFFNIPELENHQSLIPAIKIALFHNIMDFTIKNNHFGLVNDAEHITKSMGIDSLNDLKDYLTQFYESQFGIKLDFSNPNEIKSVSSELKQSNFDNFQSFLKTVQFYQAIDDLQLQQRFPEYTVENIKNENHAMELMTQFFTHFPNENVNLNRPYYHNPYDIMSWDKLIDMRLLVAESVYISDFPQNANKVDFASYNHQNKTLEVYFNNKENIIPVNDFLTTFKPDVYQVMKP